MNKVDPTPPHSQFQFCHVNVVMRLVDEFSSAALLFSDGLFLVREVPLWVSCERGTPVDISVKEETQWL